VVGDILSTEDIVRQLAKIFSAVAGHADDDILRFRQVQEGLYIYPDENGSIAYEEYLRMHRLSTTFSTVTTGPEAVHRVFDGSHNRDNSPILVTTALYSERKTNTIVYPDYDRIREYLTDKRFKVAKDLLLKNYESNQRQPTRPKYIRSWWSSRIYHLMPNQRWFHRSLKTKGIFLRWMAFKAQGVIQVNQGAQRMWGKNAEWKWKDTMTKYQNKVFDVIQRKYVEEREEKVIGKRRDKKVGQEEEWGMMLL
jgi:hypothetical protein